MKRLSRGLGETNNGSPRVRHRFAPPLSGVLLGLFAVAIVIAGEEQHREVEDAELHGEAVDSSVRRTVSDAEPRRTVSDAELRESVSDAEPRQTKAKAEPSSEFSDGKILGEAVKSGDGAEMSGARDDERDEPEDAESRD